MLSLCMFPYFHEVYAVLSSFLPFPKANKRKNTLFPHLRPLAVVCINNYHVMCSVLRIEGIIETLLLHFVQDFRGRFEHHTQLV